MSLTHRRGSFSIGIAVVFGIVNSSAALAADPLLTGKFARMTPEAMLVITDTGEVSVPVAQMAAFHVRAKGKLGDLPESPLPCLVSGSWKAAEPTVVQAKKLFIRFPEKQLREFGGTIYLEHAGGTGPIQTATFDIVLGTMTGGIVPAFAIRREQVHYDLLVDNGGNNPHHVVPGPFAGQTVSLKADADGVFDVDYDFGTNVTMAGKNATVTVLRDSTSPATGPPKLNVFVRRTEPLDLRPYLQRLGLQAPPTKKK